MSADPSWDLARSTRFEQAPTHPPEPSIRRLLLKPEEAADVLGIGRSTLYELLAAGVIDSVHIGKARRVPVAALEEYVGRLRVEQNSFVKKGF